MKALDASRYTVRPLYISRFSINITSVFCITDIALTEVTEIFRQGSEQFQTHIFLLNLMSLINRSKANACIIQTSTDCAETLKIFTGSPHLPNRSIQVQVTGVSFTKPFCMHSSSNREWRFTTQGKDSFNKSAFASSGLCLCFAWFVPFTRKIPLLFESKIQLFARSSYHNCDKIQE